MDAPRDIYDGEPWSEVDVEDLKGAVAYGWSLEEAAEFLCRSGTPLDVAAKARELCLTWQTGLRRFTRDESGESP
jgi:hypothetical protein